MLAAIDIGTNSFHLVVARVGPNGRLDVVTTEKEMVRLGSGPADMKELDPEAIDRGIDALTRMRQIAQSHGARIRAVATSAVREAQNAAVFLRRARDEAGVDVDVISGIEEARLIHLGVLQAVPAFDKRLVLVDIGGGSTEILVGEQGEVLMASSLKLGAIRLTERFFRTEQLHPGAVDACRRSIRSTLVPVVREVKRLGFQVAIGSSGTIEAVAALVNARRGSAPPQTFNNFEFTREEVNVVVEDVLTAGTVEARRALPGMDERRADIILAGSLILEGVMAELGIDQMVVSGYALREGLLLDALQRERGEPFHELQDVRRHSVLRLAELMDPDCQHAAQVARLALELFDQTRDLGLHDVSLTNRELLEAAALLANVGLFISHDRHHKHSYYVIRYSDRLVGFTDHEIELIALVARYHRKSPPKSSHPEFAALRSEDQGVVRTLAGLLRVAIGLDRTHAGLVQQVECQLARGGKQRVLVVNVSGGDSTADLSLELYSANERKDLLEEVTGLPVVIADVSARPHEAMTASAEYAAVSRDPLPGGRATRPCVHVWQVPVPASGRLAASRITLRRGAEGGSARQRC
ncbi:MAG: Ppx/GppA family phosphatase [Acidimicrobiales bacterium]|nr:Ppx/GppA family phosphatase [Acidimicrobiales bacterium]